MMDPVTKKVVVKLLEDTVGAEASTPSTCGLEEDLSKKVIDKPVGNKSGKRSGPPDVALLVRSGMPTDSVDQSEGGATDPCGIDDSMMRELPNSTGRMARMRRKK